MLFVKLLSLISTAEPKINTAPPFKAYELLMEKLLNLMFLETSSIYIAPPLPSLTFAPFILIFVKIELYAYNVVLALLPLSVTSPMYIPAP